MKGKLGRGGGGGRGSLHLWGTIVREQQPEAEDDLRQEVEDGEGDDLSVDGDFVREGGCCQDTLFISQSFVLSMGHIQFRERKGGRKGTYIGYSAKLMSTNPPMDPKNRRVCTSLTVAARRPLNAI